MVIGGAVEGDREQQAGPHRGAVDQDRAGAADAVLAADVGAGQPQVVAQGVGEQPARVGRSRSWGAPLTVKETARSSTRHAALPSAGCPGLGDRALARARARGGDGSPRRRGCRPPGRSPRRRGRATAVGVERRRRPARAPGRPAPGPAPTLISATRAPAAPVEPVTTRADAADGVVAVPAGDLDEGGAAAGRRPPERRATPPAHRAARAVSIGPTKKSPAATSREPSALSQGDAAVEQQQHRRHLGGRVAVHQAADGRAPVADRRVRDLPQRLPQQRASRRTPRRRARPRCAAPARRPVRRPRRPRPRRARARG